MHRCARHFFPEGRGKVIAHDIYGGRIAQALPLARARANARRRRLHHLTHMKSFSCALERANLRISYSLFLFVICFCSERYSCFAPWSLTMFSKTCYWYSKLIKTRTQ